MPSVISYSAIALLAMQAMAGPAHPPHGHRRHHARHGKRACRARASQAAIPEYGLGTDNGTVPIYISESAISIDSASTSQIGNGNAATGKSFYSVTNSADIQVVALLHPLYPRSHRSTPTQSTPFLALSLPRPLLPRPTTASPRPHSVSPVLTHQQPSRPQLSLAWPSLPALLPSKSLPTLQWSPCPPLRAPLYHP